MSARTATPTADPDTLPSWDESNADAYASPAPNQAAGVKHKKKSPPSPSPSAREECAAQQSKLPRREIYLCKLITTVGFWAGPLTGAHINEFLPTLLNQRGQFTMHVCSREKVLAFATAALALNPDCIDWSMGNIHPLRAHRLRIAKALENELDQLERADEENSDCVIVGAAAGRNEDAYDEEGEEAEYLNDLYTSSDSSFVDKDSHNEGEEEEEEEEAGDDSGDEYHLESARQAALGIDGDQSENYSDPDNQEDDDDDEEEGESVGYSDGVADDDESSQGHQPPSSRGKRASGSRPPPPKRKIITLDDEEDEAIPMPNPLLSNSYIGNKLTLKISRRSMSQSGELDAATQISTAAPIILVAETQRSL